MTVHRNHITLLIATRNAHKVGEIRAILGDDLRYLTLNDFPDAPNVVEDADTFDGNATKKATELARWLAAEISNLKSQISNSVWVLADDSGLEVDALGGAPGVHSARFAALDSGKAGNSSDVENNAKLLRLLKDVLPEKRTARFRCVLALVPVEGRESRVEGQNPKSATPINREHATNVGAGNPQPCSREAELFEGVCEGRIGFEPHGRGGFGYDPLFVPNGFDQTFAELGEEVKNRLSHRARALEKLKAKFVI